MANTLLTPQVVALEALRILSANCVYKDLVHNDFSQEFNKVGDTVNVRARNVIHSKNFLGSSVTKQNITESSVAVKLDRYRDTTVEVTSKDWTLALKDFSSQVLEPVLIGMAEDIDADIAAALYANAGTVITKTANPTDLSDIAKLGKALDGKKCPKENRSLVFSVDHKYAYAIQANLSYVSYAGDNLALREALLGKLYTMNTYMDQNNPHSTSASAGSATSYKVALTKGSTSVAITDASAATATMKKGEGFIVNGVAYYFAADVTCSSNAATATITEEAIETSSAAANPTRYITKDVSLAFQKEGLAFVTRPLELPQGAAKAYVATDPISGLAVRVVFDYDMQSKSDTISFDIIYGIKALNTDLIVALV